MQQRREDIISHKIDWVTVLIYVIMVIWGWSNIYSATYDEKEAIFQSFNTSRQLLFIGLSIFLILAILIIDIRFYETFAFVIYGAVLFLLLLVPFIGKEVGGNKAWLGFGSFGVQPSE